MRAGLLLWMRGCDYYAIEREFAIVTTTNYHLLSTNACSTVFYACVLERWYHCYAISVFYHVERCSLSALWKIRVKPSGVWSNHISTDLPNKATSYLGKETMHVLGIFNFSTAAQVRLYTIWRDIDCKVPGAVQQRHIVTRSFYSLKTLWEFFYNFWGRWWCPPWMRELWLIKLRHGIGLQVSSGYVLPVLLFE